MTVWFPKDDSHADLSSHDAFADGAPHNTFKRLRDTDPVHWSDWSGGKGFWSITRHADILEMNRNHAVFSSAQGIRMEDQSYEEYLARRTFQETDPPEHMQTRIKIAKAFTKPVINQFADELRIIANEILDVALSTSGATPEMDATKTIARQLPMRMLGRILGTPDKDLPWLVEKGDALIANTDPDFTDHVLDKMQTDEYRMMPFNSPAGADLYKYAQQLMADKNASGDTDGILHMILKPSRDGTVITETEFRNFFCLLVAAGNDTTRYSIAAGIQAMAHQPELLEIIRNGDDTLWDTAADEIIRWATPALYFRRTATQDFDMHGKTIREGDKVLYWFSSANRDETVLENPFHVDLTRPANHIAFGQGGPHLCLGMWLARLEVKILFEELAKRVKSIEATGPHKFLRSNFVGGIKELPVRMNLL